MNPEPAFPLPVYCLIGVFFVLGLTGCANPTPSSTPTLIPTSTPALTTTTTTPSPTPPIGELLYAENFDNPDKLSGWDAKLNDKAQANPQDGAYRLGVNGSYVAFIQREQSFTDTIIEVDVQFLGPDPAQAGVLCRNDAGQYQFALSNAGEWAIESSGKIFAQGQAVIQTGANHVAISCIGNQLGLALNGVKLGVAQDDAFSQGQVGLTLDSKGKADVLFDNLTVRRPAPQEMTATPTPTITPEPATPTPTPSSTNTSTPTSIPTATLRPTVIPESDLTLYQTEFDNDDPTLADWKTFAYSMEKKALVTEGFKTWTVNGIYRFEQEANTRVFAIYDKDLGTADVDISISGNPPFEGHGGLGLVCRYSEAGWYQFMVEPSGGSWSVRLVKPDENGQFHFHIISSASVPKWLEGKANLRAECKGDRLTFFINGAKMVSLHDSTFPIGKVGFLGWAFAIGDDWNTADKFSARRAQWNETRLAGPAPTPGADGTIYSTDFAKLDDLKPYWTKTDLGIIGIPGSPVLIGGPGGQVAPHTYLYINDFDPATDVEISADIHPVYMFRRALICRYSEDGWYETYYLKDGKENPIVLLRTQRDAQGKFTGEDIILGSALAGSQNPVSLSLTCAGKQISVKLNGKQVISTTDTAWVNGRYGFLFMDNPPGNIRNTLLNYTVRPAQSNSTNRAAAPLLNQVVLPPAYQPGETIFAWSKDKFLFGCRGGWWGRDPDPCLWARSMLREDWDRSVQGSEVLVKGFTDLLTLFTYQPDLYDLPVEISAEASLTSKGGGMALFCRATPVGRYEFYIQPDGKWFIRRNVIFGAYLPKLKHLTILAHGQVENFSPEKMQMSATCNESDLVFTLNGVEIGRAQDTIYPEGQAGIFFDILSEGSFTNLSIKRAK